MKKLKNNSLLRTEIIQLGWIYIYFKKFVLIRGLNFFIKYDIKCTVNGYVIVLKKINDNEIVVKINGLSDSST